MRRSQNGMLRHSFFLLSALAVLMGSIDSTIVSVALPEMEQSLQTSLSWVGWTLTSYLVVQVVMFPLAGKLSDSLGRRRSFLFFVATFTVSSLACGLAPNVGVLIVFRAVQAIGGGGLVPAAVGIVAYQYRERRAQMLGLISSVMPVGAIIGPNLGGFLLQNSTWRALFWINVPIGIVVIAGVLWLLPDTEKGDKRPPLHVDGVGLAQFTLAVVTLMGGMSVIANDPVQARNPFVWGMLVASVVLGAAFVRHLRRTKDPVMEYALVAHNPFLAANLYNFLFGAVTMGFFSFIPYYAVVKYGLSPFASGAVLTPRAMIVVGVSILASLYASRLGYRLPLLAGMALVAVMLVLLAQGWTVLNLGPLSLQGFWLLAAIISVGGLGMGISNPASNNASIDLIPNKAAALTGIRGTFRLTGGSVSISGIVLALSFFPDPAAGLSRIFLVFALVLVVTVPLVWMIPDGPRRSRSADFNNADEHAPVAQRPSREGNRLVPARGSAAGAGSGSGTPRDG